MVSAALNACRDWSTAVLRRYRIASLDGETNLSQSTTISSPLNKVRGENFSVAARLLPAKFRRQLLSIYVFARLVDDIGDEATGNRITLLDRVARDLDRIYSGHEPRLAALSELAVTIHARSIPRVEFDKLIEANRQDQYVNRYATYADLVDYCELSANSVGHLVLYVFDRATPQRLAWSDKICTALQILEHCQDVVEDLDRGRIYLPGEDLDRFKVVESALKSPPANHAVRALLAFQVQRAVRLLDEGTPLVRTLQGAARLAIGGYLAGGLATAEAIAAVRYDVLSGPPRPRKTDAARHWAWLLLAGRRA